LAQLDQVKRSKKSCRQQSLVKMIISPVEQPRPTTGTFLIAQTLAILPSSDFTLDEFRML
jgi:hypothetical protein